MYGVEKVFIGCSDETFRRCHRGVKPEYQAVNNTKKQKSKIAENTKTCNISSPLYGNSPVLELITRCSPVPTLSPLPFDRLPRERTGGPEGTQT